MSSGSFNPFAAGVIQRVAPSTAPQREVIASAQLSDEANTGFNEAVSVTIQGAIDPQLMVASFAALLARHEAFHVTFSRKGDEICLQEDIRAKLEYIDLQQHSAVDQQQYQQTLAKNIAISPMNLEEGPLVFGWLLQLGQEHYQLLIAAHHVICDGWTFGLMLQELADIYNAGGSAALLPAAPSFLDFAEQQDVGQIANTDIDYWKNKFASQPPNLDLPLDQHRPSQRPFAAARFDYHIDHTLANALRQQSAKLKSSLVNTVLAAYFTLLYRLSGNEDIVVGLPVAGQAALNQLQMAGHMVQLLPIRVQCDGDTSFESLLAQVKSEVLDASEHANFTFGELVKDMKIDRSRVPLISSIFNIDQPMPPLQLGDAVATVSALPRAAENFELFLNIIPADNSLQIETTYSTALFSEASINAWLNALEKILKQVVSEPATVLSDFSLTDSLPPLIEKNNQTQTALNNSSLSQAFRHSVAQYPQQTAVIADDVSLSYQQLDQQVHLLALALHQQGVQPGDVVGICVRRSEKLLLSVLAIQAIGAAYLPLDPGFPKDRLHYMVEDAAAVMVLGDPFAERVLADTQVTLHSLESLIQPLQAELLAQESDIGKAAVLPAIEVSGDALAYIIYTSGSTGKPKGVKVSHQSMINFLESMACEPVITAQQSLLAVTTLAFDISILELFLPLLTGACVVVATENDLKEGESLAALINKHDISLMQATPATWRLLLASSWGDTALNQRSLIALCGGEPLPRDLAQLLLPRVAELWNMFGPTETTVWSTCQRISSLDQPIAVGTPIANTQIFILDEQQRPLPECTPGELYIGGYGVALGYHNRETLTRERFIDHPEWGRIYRTGDLAKWRPDGLLQHLGRMDDQVKLRGYRIELGEIEHAIVNSGLVAQAAVYLWQVSELDVRLVACCVAATNNDDVAVVNETLAIETTALRKSLRTVLPAYMVPQYFIALDQLPLTPNGKVDKRALPRPEMAEPSAILGGGLLENAIEKTLAAIWFDVIQPVRPLGRDDNFFDVGGHSLLALEAIRQIEIQYQVTLTMTDLITCKLSALADIIDNAKQRAPIESAQAVALASQSERRLSPDQSRWLDIQLRDASVTYYNLPAAWRLCGAFDVDSFLRSFKRLVERQTALRTCIVPHADGGFRLGILHSDDVQWIQYRDLSSDTNAYEIAKADIDALATTPFKLIGEPLLRARLYQLANNDYLFFVCPNQLVFDGWSFDLLLKELELCYQSTIQKEAARLDHLVLEYRDHCEWMAGRMAKRLREDAKAFHQAALVDAVFIDIGDGANSNGNNNNNGNSAAVPGIVRSTMRLDQAGFDKVNAFCEQHQLRLHELILSAFTEVLGSQLRLPAFSLALPVTGRYNASVINLIGGFISMLPFAVKVPLLASAHDNFIGYCRQVSKDLKAFHEQQDLSFAELLSGAAESGRASAALISASFSFQDIRNRPTAFAGVSLDQVDIDRGQTEFPLEFWVRVESDGVLLVIDSDASVSLTADADKAWPRALLEQVYLRLNQLDKLEHSPGDTEAMQVTESQSPSDQSPSVQSTSKPSLWRKLFG